MTLNEFITQFAAEFEETDTAVFGSETRFQELEEWSSLLALSVIALAKMELNKALSSAELRSCNTIEELYNLLNSK